VNAACEGVVAMRTAPLAIVAVLVLLAFEVQLGSYLPGIGPHRNAAYKEHGNFCVDVRGKDLDEIGIGGISSLTACKAMCTSTAKCIAVEWYSKPWQGKQCYAIIGSKTMQVFGARGHRILDASCHVQQQQGLLDEMVDALHQDVQQLLQASGHVTSNMQNKLQEYARRAIDLRSRIDSYEHHQASMSSPMGRRLRGHRKEDDPDHAAKLAEMEKIIEKQKQKIHQLEVQLRSNAPSETDEDGEQGEERGGHDIDSSMKWLWTSIALCLILCCCFCIHCWSLAGMIQSRCGFKEQGLDRDGHPQDMEMKESMIKTDMEMKESMIKTVQYYRMSMLLYPLIPWAFQSWTTCEKGTPPWVYVIYAPFLFFTKGREFYMLQQANVSWSPLVAFHFVMGIVEHADWFTDGAFPVQAWKCGSEATEPWAASFDESKVAFVFAPSVGLFKFWGCAALLLAASASTQMAIGSLNAAAAADVAGMAALAKQLEEDDGEDEGAEDDDEEKVPLVPALREFFGEDFMVSKSSVKLARKVLVKLATGVAKYLLENSFQLWMQSSFFAIIFSRTSDQAKQKMLLSMGLGIFSLLVKFFENIYLTCGIFKDSEASKVAKILAFWSLIPAFCSVIIAMWTCLKLHYAYQCETHMWNFGWGMKSCVHDLRVA